MRIEDIRIGAKVTYFDGGTRQAVDAVVTGVLDLGPNRYYETIYVKSIGSGQERALALCDYKKVWPSHYLSWCFSDNVRFRRHIVDGWAPKKPIKREPDPKYAALDHGNNARAKEARLAAQREFVNKVTEQGFYWQRCRVRSADPAHPWATKLDWVKRDKPEFKFDKEKGRYFLVTPTGWVNGGKFGRSVRAEEPEAEKAEAEEGSQRREKES
jgi:hypothetical protein